MRITLSPLDLTRAIRFPHCVHILTDTASASALLVRMRGLLMPLLCTVTGILKEAVFYLPGIMFSYVLFTRHDVFPNHCKVIISIGSVVLVVEAKRMPNFMQYTSFAARDRHVASIWCGRSARHVCILSSNGTHRNDLTTANTANT